jgi:hypothetical protein
MLWALACPAYSATALASRLAVLTVNKVANDQTDEEGERGDNFEVEQRFTAHAANFFHVRHAGDAGDYRAENDQGDDHGDEADETVTERLHGHGFRGAQIAERYRESDGDQDLHPEICVERLFAHDRGRGH